MKDRDCPIAFKFEKYSLHAYLNLVCKIHKYTTLLNFRNRSLITTQLPLLNIYGGGCFRILEAGKAPIPWW